MASQQYLDLLKGMAELHVRKSAGYSGHDNPDAWANFRKAEAFGVTPETGALIRLSDKYSRAQSLLRDPANDQLADEGIEDTMMDLAAYALIYICLRRERLAGTGPEGNVWPTDVDGNCTDCGAPRGGVHKDECQWLRVFNEFKADRPVITKAAEDLAARRAAKQKPEPTEDEEFPPLDAEGTCPECNLPTLMGHADTCSKRKKGRSAE